MPTLVSYISNDTIEYNLSTIYQGGEAKIKIFTPSKGGLCWLSAYKMVGVQNGHYLRADKEKDGQLLKIFKRGQFKADARALIISSFMSSLMHEAEQDGTEVLEDLNKHLNPHHEQKTIIIERFINSLIVSGELTENANSA